MPNGLRKIRYRFIYQSNSTLISKYNKFYTKAEIYNDIIELTYLKFIKIASDEGIDLSKGNIKVDSFKYNNKFDFPVNVKKSESNNKLKDTQEIFHLTFKWIK